jgi:hypothetical protein
MHSSVINKLILLFIKLALTEAFFYKYSYGYIEETWMEAYLDLITEVGFPIVGAGAAGYFVYLTLNFILDGVLDDIKQQRMFAQALDNRVKTMNSEVIRIDVKMCQAFGIRPDMERIARADGKTDARRD